MFYRTLILALSFVALNAYGQDTPDPTLKGSIDKFVAAYTAASAAEAKMGQAIKDSEACAKAFTAEPKGDATGLAALDDLAANLKSYGTLKTTLADLDAPSGDSSKPSKYASLEKELETSYEALKKREKEVQKWLDKLTALKAAYEEAGDLIEKMKGEIKDGPKASTKLGDAALKAPDTEAKFMMALGVALQDVTNATLIDNRGLLLRRPEALAKLLELLDLRTKFVAKDKAIVSARPKGYVLPSPDPVEKPKAEFDERTRSILGLLDEWMGQLEADELQHDQADETLLADYKNDPKRRRADALARAGVERLYIAAIGTTTQKLLDLATEVHATDYPYPSLPKPDRIQDAVARMTERLAKIGITAGDLSLDRKPVINIEEWTAGQIQLYYFDDVPRLLHFLSKNVTKVNDATAYRNAAETGARNLTEADANLAKRRQETSNARTALGKAETDLANTQLDLNNALSQVTAATKATQGIPNSPDVLRQQGVLNDKQAAYDAATADATNAQRILDLRTSDLTADPKNPDRVAARDKAADALGAAQKAQTAAKSELDAAKTEMARLSAAPGADAVLADKVTALKQRVTDLRQAVKDGEAAEKTAGDTMNAAMVAAAVTAKTENQAFADLRDNGEFYVSVPTDLSSGSTDPIDRVMLYGSPDSRTLFIRGDKADVDRVKAIVATLDRPTAQAEMAVYTVEIGSEASNEGTKAATKANALVRSSLQRHRDLMGEAFNLLRELIAARVKAAADDCKGTQPAGSDDEVKNMRAFFDDTVFKDVGVDEPSLCALGSRTKKDALILAALPHTDKTTTMAEALVLLALAKPKYRGDIVAAFHRLAPLRWSDSYPDWKDATAKPKDGPYVKPSKSTTIPQCTAEWDCLVKDEQCDVKLHPGWGNRFPNLKRIIGQGEGSDIVAFGKELRTELRERAADNVKQRLETEGGSALTLFGQLENIVRGFSASSSYDQTDSFYQQLADSMNLVIKAGKDRVEALRGYATFYSQIYSSDSTRINDLENQLVTSLNVIQSKATTLPCKINALKLAEKNLDQARGKEQTAAKELPKRLADWETLNSTWNRKFQLAKRRNQSAKDQRTKNPTKQVFEELLESTKADLSSVGSAPTKPSLSEVEKALKVAENEVRSQIAGLGLELVQSEFAQIGDAWKEIDNLPIAVRPPTWFETRHARRALLNESLTRLLKAVDQDVKLQITEPIMDKLSTDLIKDSRLQVGVFQKTTILASNRLIAKVDAKASSQVALGEEEDALGSAIQLATLLGSAATSNPLGILNSLKAQPKKAPPGVYGITTGNPFTVTPIFDPTGQALRFRFDFINQTMITEADGSVNPEFPRIERHSVNTEVRLSNYDIQAVSEFRSTSRLGLPERKTGGIPGLNQIAPFSELPLIGWFSWRNEQKPRIQQSLILTTTAMYPTIDDVIDVLTSGN